MADIVLKGNTSGEITITSPDVSGVNVLTLPVETGTILTTNTPLPEVSSVEFAGAGTSSGNITITAPDTDETNTLTFPETTGTFAVEKSLGMRNLIINGNMAIAQKATSVTGITTGGGYLTVDRWKTVLSTAGTWTQTQDTDVPTGQGFATSLKMDCTTANASLSAGSYALSIQYIEGFNCQQLGFGTANAKSITMSFWVKSNKTGTYIFDLRNLDADRLISQAYTISSADTWEKKTLTFAGDTAGAINNDNGIGLQCSFWFSSGSDYASGTLQTSWGAHNATNRAVGQVNLADSTDNYINITGVQLEANTTATPFETLMYSEQLALCQRYYEVLLTPSVGIGILSAPLTGVVSASWCTWFFKQDKRAVPTFSLGSTLAWINSTPTVYAGYSSVNFNSTNYFYAGSGTADTPSLIANAEL